MKVLSRFILVLIFIVSSANLSLACSCIEYFTPDCVKVVRSDAVFYGKVEKLFYLTQEEGKPKVFTKTDSVKHSEGGYFVARFSIIESYKGEIGKTLDVYSHIGTSCTGDYSNMKVGDKWTIYADFATKSQQWLTDIGMCSYSRKGSKDTFLQDFKNGQTKETVQGKILKDYSPSSGGIPNISVKIEGEGFASSTITKSGKSFFDEESGTFLFEVPSSGKYKVSFILPSSLAVYNSYEKLDVKTFPTEKETLVEYSLEVPKGLCHFTQLESIPLDLKATGTISGKFVSGDNQPIPKFYPQLCKVKENETASLGYSNCRKIYDLPTNGEYEFKGLREGIYLLITSNIDFPELHSPFFRHYFPGVRKFADAQIINLEQGQKLSLPDFYLPASLPLKEIKGQLFWKEGVPVTNKTLGEADVCFSFYNPQEPKYPLSMSKCISPNKSENGITLNENGSFTFEVFKDINYLVLFQSENKKGKKFSKEVAIKADDSLQPLTVILERDKD